MGSRLKENPERTFYWFFQASCPIARDKDPGLLFQFPEDFNDEECVQSLPRFCFPYDIERVKEVAAVQHFTFVLTDLEGCQRFGFCRLTSSSQTCLCILSYLPWFEVFYKLLNNLADCVTKGQANEMRELLSALYTHPVPLASGSVTLQLGEQLQISAERPGLDGHAHSSMIDGSGIPYFIAPDPKALPSIPESRNLTELVVAVDVGNLLQLYASMLFERRILICCSKLSTLTACVHACSGMLYPMYWQHIFIPVLPPHLLDYCCAPMPYLIGVHSSLLERVRSRALEDVVILNVDTNTMETPHDDLKKLPSDVVTALKVRLKRQATSPGAGVARAFLRSQALLFGGYREALVYPENAPVVFSEDLFLTHKSNSMKQFLQSSVHLQLFKQFIDGRLEMLNQGREPNDLFEEEIVLCGVSSGGSKSYQQWVGNLKKGGGALILTVKSKAQMCKTAKSHSKFGLKNFISTKQKDSHALQRGGSVCGMHTYRLIQSDCLQNRLPITQHFGKSRPRRPTRNTSGQEEEPNHHDNHSISWGEEESPAESGSSADDLLDEADLSVLTDPEEMDLLGEIFDTLSAQSCRESGQLYATRSLDLFSPDSTHFITKRSLTTPSQESLSLSFCTSGSLMSWEEEERLREGPDIEEEEEEEQPESEALDVSDSHYGSTEEPPVDLGRLVDDLTGLEEELQDELGVQDAAQGTKLAVPSVVDGTTTKNCSEKEEVPGVEETSNIVPNSNTDQVSEEELLGTLARDSQQEKGVPPGEDEATEPEPGPKLETEAHTLTQLSSPEPKLEEDEKHEEEGSRKTTTPKILSTVALFQAKVSHSGISPESKKPAFFNPQSMETSQKTSPRTPRVQVGPARLAAVPKPDDSRPGVKIPNSSEPPGNDQDLPPVKVSELKKRFEQ